MKHLADELDSRWLVRVLLLKMHDKAKCSILKRCVRRSDDDSIPEEGISFFSARDFMGRQVVYQVMTLSAIGDADTPAGGSVCIL